jgi:uncharacterized delta-60 repeat protein
MQHHPISNNRSKEIIQFDMRYTLLSLVLVFSILQVTAQEIDPEFNAIIAGTPEIEQIEVLPDGKILALGNMILADGLDVHQLVRLNADGSHDVSFEPDSFLDSMDIRNFAVLTDGSIIVNAAFVPSDFELVVKLSSKGVLDESYRYEFADPLVVRRLAVQSANKVLLSENRKIIRLTDNGGLDDSFISVEFSRGGFGDIMIQDDNKILITGGFEEVDGVAKNTVVRLNENGSLDETFDVGVGANESGYETIIALANDGNYLLGGSFTTFRGQGIESLVKLTTSGSIDPSFNTDIGSSIRTPRFILVAPNGNLFLEGDYFCNSTTLIKRFNADGIEDTSWDDHACNGFGGHGQGITIDDAVLWGSGLAVAGSFSKYAETTVMGLCRLDENGGLDPSFSSDLRSKAEIFTTFVDGSKILIGGLFSYVNGETMWHLARLNADGSIDESFDPGSGPSDRVTHIFKLEDGDYILGGHFSKYSGSWQSGMVRIDPDGSLDQHFSIDLDRTYAGDDVVGIYEQPDGKIVVAGRFNRVNGVDRKYLARVDAQGSLDLSFNSANDVPARINDMIVKENGEFLIAGHNSNEPGFISLRDQHGDPVNGFEHKTEVLPRIRKLAIQSDEKIIAAGSNIWGSGLFLDQAILRLNADGSFDHTFNSEAPNYYCNDIEVLSGDEFIVGTTWKPFFMSFSSDGYGNDTPGWEFDGNVLDINRYENSFLIAGNFHEVGSKQVYSIALITSTIVAAPGNLEISDGTLHWVDFATDESGFQVFRSLNGTDNFALLNTLGPNFESYTDSEIEEKNTYFYKVRAIREEEHSSFSNIASYPADVLPNYSEFNALSVSATSITLGWYVPDSEAELQILTRTDGSSDTTIYLPAGVYTYVDSGLSPSTAYTFTIQSVNQFSTSGVFETQSSTLPLETGRASAVSITIGSDVYLGLGRNEFGYLSDFLRLDVPGFSTQKMADFPGVGRIDAVAFAIDGFCYVGLGADETGVALADFYRYDPGTDTWSQVSDFVGGARTDAVAFAIDGLGYVGTGYDGNSDQADFYIYNPVEDTWTPTQTFSGDARREAVAFASNGKGYVVGGYNFDTFFFNLSDVQEYDPDTDQWSEVVFASIDLSSNYATAFTIGDYGYIAYGSHQEVIKFSSIDYSLENLGDLLNLGDESLFYIRADALSFVVDNIPYLATGRSASFSTEYFHSDIYRIPLSLEVSFLTSGNGSIDGETSQNIPHGSDASAVTAIPDEGFHFKHWENSSGDFITDQNPLTVTNVVSDTALFAVFEINAHTLSIIAGDNGSIDGETSQNIPHGSDASAVTAIPDEGFHFKHWENSSGDFITDQNPLTVTNVVSDTALFAVFEINAYTLSFIAGDNGSIDGETSQNIPHGSDASAVTAIPDEGFHFKHWENSSGNFITDQNPLTVTNVVCDSTLLAYFELAALTSIPDQKGTIQTYPNPVLDALYVDDIEGSVLEVIVFRTKAPLTSPYQSLSWAKIETAQKRSMARQHM